MNNKLEGSGRALIKVLSQDFSGETREKHEEFHSRYSVS